VAELPHRVPPVVGHQVDLAEPRPGTSHSAKVRMGICRLSRLPGFVPERPFTRSRLRSGARIRSIVAAETVRSLARTSGASRSSPALSRAPTISPENVEETGGWQATASTDAHLGGYRWADSNLGTQLATHTELALPEEHLDRLPGPAAWKERTGWASRHPAKHSTSGLRAAAGR
jgi:hypothetical protein